MATLPNAEQPEFAEQMRELIKSGKVTTRELRQTLEDVSQPADQRFASLYGLLQELNREEKEQQYADLVNRYAGEFHNQPYYHTFRAVVATGDGTSESGLRRALAHSRKAIVDFPDRAGVLHQYAALCARLGDLSREVDQQETEKALDAVERAIAVSSRNNPNFHRTRARLLRQLGKLDQALLEINTAIRLQDASTPSEIRQLAQFEAFRSMLYFDKSSRGLESRIEQAKRDLNAAKSEQVQLLGVLAAVIALITSVVTISTRVEASVALRFIIVAVGTITVAFSTLMWSGGISRWWRVIPGIVVGFALVAWGLWVKVEMG
jgi:tetratricopeptide (TPR) repeat protein